ncbi:Uu.00g029630.m01.CDS01 [Anthostomella pinea]|uniref:Uu.00g029630.m01.CDS01 n=1 Tax=Anthostomella pinea TaxID=933095 RepID=A0AAI8V960_9PEZI|nr:Uu.00g029630.m01.CDS01 [Anthostomella pinea]
MSPEHRHLRDPSRLPFPSHRSLVHMVAVIQVIDNMHRGEQQHRQTLNNISEDWSEEGITPDLTDFPDDLPLIQLRGSSTTHSSPCPSSGGPRSQSTPGTPVHHDYVSLSQLYQSLPVSPEDRSIRLLDLDPLPTPKSSDDAVPLTGKLRTVSLKSSPRFAVLSYVWGPYSEPTSDVLIIQLPHALGVCVNITMNCKDALLALRRKYGAVCIWIDAVCINQSDYVEKASQILLMEEIYTWAHMVYVWLGPSTSTSKRVIKTLYTASEGSVFLDIGALGGSLSTRRRFAQMGSIYLRLWGHLWLRAWRKQLDVIDIFLTPFTFYKGASYLKRVLSTFVRGVEIASPLPRCGETEHTLRERTYGLSTTDRTDLFGSAWFGRGWTFQEIILASEVTILCGSDALKWDVLVRSLCDLRSIDMHDEAWFCHTGRRPRRLIDIVNVWKQVERPTTWNGWQRRRERASQSTIDGYQALGRSSPYPYDLGQTARFQGAELAVEAQFFERTIHCSGVLERLMPEMKKLLELPGDNPLIMAFLRTTLAFVRLLRAIKNNIATTYPYDAPTPELFARVMCLQYLDDEEPRFHPPSRATEPTGVGGYADVAFGGELFDMWYHRISKVPQAIIDKATKLEPGPYNDIEKQIFSRCEPGNRQADDANIAMVAKTVEFCNLIAGKRNIFVTEKGHIGSGPEAMQDGDEIYWITGVSVPMVLRPTGEAAETDVGSGMTDDDGLSRFTVVGPAFVYGFMKTHETEESKLVSVTLV